MNTLKSARLEKGWTQQQVADKLGITKGTYSNIERKQRNPSLKTALKIQKILHVPLEEMGIEGESKMAEYEVEYASFTKVRFEAESQEEAEMIASIMESEEIEEKGKCEGYVIWNEPVRIEKEP